MKTMTNILQFTEILAVFLINEQISVARPGLL